MSFFRSPKLWKSQGKDLGCTEDVEVFPSQISAYPSPDWQYGDGRYHAKELFHSTAFQGVLTYGVSQHLLPPRNEPRLSAILCLPSFPMLDEHILHNAHLQSNEETTAWTCAFSLCRWQYRYITRVLPTFVRNVFYGGCSVFI